MTAYEPRAGDVVDLKDPNFGWRGQYVVMRMTEGGLVEIRNLGTQSRQRVKPVVLRPSRLQPFAIAWKNQQGRR